MSDALANEYDPLPWDEEGIRKAELFRKDIISSIFHFCSCLDNMDTVNYLYKIGIDNTSTKDLVSIKDDLEKQVIRLDDDKHDDFMRQFKPFNPDFP